jgi:hypothetical protein
LKDVKVSVNRNDDGRTKTLWKLCGRDEKGEGMFTMSPHLLLLEGMPKGALEGSQTLVQKKCDDNNKPSAKSAV